MKEQVIELNKEKFYDLRELNEDQIQKVAAFIFDNRNKNQVFENIENVVSWIDEFKTNAFLGYRFDNLDSLFGFAFKDISEVNNAINAVTLFSDEEWLPKQGNKVLVSHDRVDWFERIFVVKLKAELHNL